MGAKNKCAPPASRRLGRLRKFCSSRSAQNTCFAIVAPKRQVNELAIDPRAQREAGAHQIGGLGLAGPEVFLEISKVSRKNVPRAPPRSRGGKVPSRRHRRVPEFAVPSQGAPGTAGGVVPSLGTRGTRFAVPSQDTPGTAGGDPLKRRNEINAGRPNAKPDTAKDNTLPSSQ